jgi:hypothetical protein
VTIPYNLWQVLTDRDLSEVAIQAGSFWIEAIKIHDRDRLFK